MPNQPSIQARPIPSSDLVFGRVVKAVASTVRSAEQLRARLRPIYPEVVISERLLSGEPLAVYVYRDGRLKPEASGAWWTEPGAARVTINLASGAILDANERWAALVGSPAAALLGRPLTDFLSPEALSTASLLLGILVETGEAHSSVILRRANGASILTDFRAILDGDRVRVWYRPRPTIGPPT
ncbi:MAG: PAS domain-containing protein [Chloroflexi bacterium]|nr:PAS domain-containing protein [Chloroflexota bacterium]